MATRIFHTVGRGLKHTKNGLQMNAPATAFTRLDSSLLKLHFDTHAMSNLCFASWKFNIIDKSSAWRSEAKR